MTRQWRLAPKLCLCAVSSFITLSDFHLAQGEDAAHILGYYIIPKNGHFM